MVIKKSNGSNYNLGGRDSLKSYRPDGQDIKLLDKFIYIILPQSQILR